MEEPQTRFIKESVWVSEWVFILWRKENPISRPIRWPGYCNILTYPGILLLGDKNKDVMLWELGRDGHDKGKNCV